MGDDDIQKMNSLEIDLLKKLFLLVEYLETYIVFWEKIEMLTVLEIVTMLKFILCLIKGEMLKISFSDQKMVV